MVQVGRESEANEALKSLDIYRTSTTDQTPVDAEGMGMSSDCPRKGSILLQSWDRRVIIINTTCNTWRCVGCRDRLKSAFKAKVNTGVSRTGRCAFITITYKAGGQRLLAAECVKKDWQAFTRRLRLHAKWVSEMEWLRVMELTKAGTPHHHLVMGPVPQEKRVRCWKRYESLDATHYLRNLDSCACLSHTMAREWYAVTGDSWLIHGMPVYSAKGAGSYMAKYMGKEFDGDRAAELGMQRRWSTSRGWPGTSRMRLQQSGRPEGWARHSFRYGQVEADIEGGPADLLGREGDKLDHEMASKRSAERLIRTIERGSHATNVGP